MVRKETDDDDDEETSTVAKLLAATLSESREYWRRALRAVLLAFARPEVLLQAQNANSGSRQQRVLVRFD